MSRLAGPDQKAGQLSPFFESALPVHGLFKDAEECFHIIRGPQLCEQMCGFLLKVREEMAWRFLGSNMDHGFVAAALGWFCRPQASYCIMCCCWRLALKRCCRRDSIVWQGCCVPGPNSRM